jgi:hypothetical protein
MAALPGAPNRQARRCASDSAGCPAIRGCITDAEGPPGPILPLGQGKLLASGPGRFEQLCGRRLPPRPLFREPARADLFQHLVHLRPQRFSEFDEPRRSGDGAVLAGPRVEVHLPHHPHFAHLLEGVGELTGEIELEQHGLRRAAGVHQGLDGGYENAPEGGSEGLLGEEIEGRLVVHRHLDAPRPGRADAAGERQHARPCRSRGIPMHSDEAREPGAAFVHHSHPRSDHARRHENHVDGLRGFDEPEGHVVARGEVEEHPRCQVRRDVARVHLRHHFVRNQQHHHVGPAAGLGDRDSGEAVGLGLHPGSIGNVSHHHLDPGVAKIERLGAALVSVSDHRHGLLLQGGELGVLVVIQDRHGWAPPRRRVHESHGGPKRVGRPRRVRRPVCSIALEGGSRPVGRRP